MGFKKNWIGFLFAFLLPIVVILFWWGAFNHTDIQQTRSAPIHYAYIAFYGNLADMSGVQDKVRTILQRQEHVATGYPITVLYTDPRHSKKDDQRARVGFIVANDAHVVTPLQTADIPAMPVVRARVTASMQLAPGMAYQALYDWLKPRGRDIRLPTVEIYTPGQSINKMGTLTVDMPDN